MGNSNYRVQNNQATAPVDPKMFLQTELPKFIVHDHISKGKFMKVYSGKIDGTPVMVKVYIRSQEEDRNMTEIARKLTHVWNTLSPSRYPNLLPYQMWIKSSYRIPKTSNLSPTYLIRQYLISNLHDRLSTRPFLHNIEKRFLVFQIMKALETCHEEKICHGDIKPENIMVTSWNWIVLTDFSPFKPTKIPVDDPADFQYFFDTMDRRRCYIAPERFYTNNTSDSRNRAQYLADLEKIQPSFEDGDKDKLTQPMDVFSLGLTIAEVFLAGEPILDLPGMLKYVSGASSTSSQSLIPFEHLLQEDSPAAAILNRIDDEDIKSLVVDMTQRNPEKRTSVNQVSIFSSHPPDPNP